LWVRNVTIQEHKFGFYGSTWFLRTCRGNEGSFESF
jgi:hypothetical protein